MILWCSVCFAKCHARALRVQLVEESHHVISRQLDEHKAGSHESATLVPDLIEGRNGKHPSGRRQDASKSACQESDHLAPHVRCPYPTCRLE